MLTVYDNYICIYQLIIINQINICMLNIKFIMNRLIFVVRTTKDEAMTIEVCHVCSSYEHVVGTLRMHMLFFFFKSSHCINESTNLNRSIGPEPMSPTNNAAQSTKHACHFRRNPDVDQKKKETQMKRER